MGRQDVEALKTIGGEGGIRTPEAGITHLPDFESGAFNRSATSPTLPNVCHIASKVNKEDVWRHGEEFCSFRNTDKGKVIYIVVTTTGERLEFGRV